MYTRVVTDIHDLDSYSSDDLLDAYLAREGAPAALLAIAGRWPDVPAAEPEVVDDIGPNELLETLMVDEEPGEFAKVVVPKNLSSLRKADGSPNRSAAQWAVLRANRHRRIGVGVDGIDVYGVRGSEIAKACLDGGIPAPPRPQVTYSTLQQLERANRVRRAHWHDPATDQLRTYWSPVGKPNLAAGEPDD
jgi:hypothetical protein